MHMNRFPAAVVAAATAAVALAGCSTEGAKFLVIRSIEDTPTPSTTASQLPSSSPAAATPSSTAAQSRTTSPAPAAPAKLTSAGAVCETIANGGQMQPVIVQTGQVNCQEAVAVAKEYLARGAEAQGQGRYLTVQGWKCSWPYLPDRSHAESYLQCADPSGKNVVSIGS